MKKHRCTTFGCLLLTFIMIFGSVLTCNVSVEAQPASSYTGTSDWINDGGNLSYTYVDTSAETFLNSKYYNSNRAMGIAGNFHVVAFDTATLNTHTNGNVLANNLVAKVNFGTNNFADEVTYAGTYSTVNAVSEANITSSLALGNSGNTVELADNGNAFSVNGTKIDKPHNILKDSPSTKYIDLNSVETSVKSYESTLNSYPNAGVTANGTDLTITDTNHLNVYNMTVAQLKTMQGSNDILNLYGFSKSTTGSLVVNLDAKGCTDVDLGQWSLYVDGVLQTTSEVTDFSTGKVLINLYDSSKADGQYTGTVDNAKTVYASILAPEATINVNQNWNGTIVGNNVNIYAESHRCDFTGTFQAIPPNPVSLSLVGTKNLTGGTLTSKEFNFTVKDSNGNTAATGTNDATGKITFSNITYTSAGIYNYIITEDAGSVPGVTYDTSSKSISVTVTQDNNNNLVATPTYPTGGLTFSNKTILPITFSFTGTKTLTGGTLTSGEFKFTVKDSNGNAAATGTNDSTGGIIFTSITYDYTSVGTHTYTITEDQGSVPGVTYDTSSKNVTVTVTKDSNGILTATPTYPTGGLTFTNKTILPITFSFTGTKTLTGGTLASGEFKFTVKDSNGNAAATGTNDSTGGITFTSITYDYTSVGTHTYTITEDPGSVPGVTYDTSSKNVTVTVTKGSNGTLTATPAYPSGGLNFTNNFVMVNFNIVKVDASNTNTTLQGAMFKLYSYNSDLNTKTLLSGPVAIDQNGKASFSNLTVGEYILEETKAPSGYQLPLGDWKITVTPTGEIQTAIFGNTSTPALIKSTDGSGAVVYKVPNVLSYVLPNTGGQGIYLIMIFGGALIFISIILLIKFRRHAF